ncbi:hypothetical protein ANCDUO_19879 [Ancylostoma duodenale]|uniref:Uncharacterized protein n=1 Tax=Ancylostoma duodenale TaxID=51022 RepID=A0A0C2FYY1_9BILA|nr:hypothetical protein ANCDUO_19879 [Ancylostoma duodenale]
MGHHKGVVGERVCGSGRFSNVYSADLIEPEERKVAIKNSWYVNSIKTTYSINCTINYYRVRGGEGGRTSEKLGLSRKEFLQHLPEKGLNESEKDHPSELADYPVETCMRYQSINKLMVDAPDFISHQAIFTKGAKNDCGQISAIPRDRCAFTDSSASKYSDAFVPFYKKN